MQTSVELNNGRCDDFLKNYTVLLGGKQVFSMIATKDHNDVSQPPPLSQGETVVTPRTDIKVEQEAAHMFVFHAGVNLDEIVRAVNQVGAAPGDLVAILEALKEAGSLRAELIVI